MKTSKFLSLNVRDILKGLLVATLSPVFVIIQQSLENGIFTFDWKMIGLAALGGGLAYITKNFFTKSEEEVQSIGTPNVPKKS